MYTCLPALRVRLSVGAPLTPAQVVKGTAAPYFHLFPCATTVVGYHHALPDIAEYKPAEVFAKHRAQRITLKPIPWVGLIVRPGRADQTRHLRVVVAAADAPPVALRH